MEVILVRHSVTQGNKEKRFVGRLDVPLAPEGETLARETAPLLPTVEHLYISPMLRCRRTAELLWPGVEHTVVDDLQERLVGARIGLRQHIVVDGRKAARLLHPGGQRVHIGHLGTGHIDGGGAGDKLPCRHGEEVLVVGTVRPIEVAEHLIERSAQIIRTGFDGLLAAHFAQQIEENAH